MLEEAKRTLLQCATPEAVVRLKKSHLSEEEDDLLWLYFTEQRHGSLLELLQQEMKERKSTDADIFMQVGAIDQLSLHRHCACMNYSRLFLCSSWDSKRAIERPRPSPFIVIYEPRDFGRYKQSSY